MISQNTEQLNSASTISPTLPTHMPVRETRDSSILLKGIETRSASITVVGLGYVGLPLACHVAKAGFETYAFDVDREKTTQLSQSKSYLSHIDDSLIAECMDSGRFHPTNASETLRIADVIVICVPTPLSDSRDPDLSYVEAVGRAISAQLRKGQLIILESTTWPGSTRKVLIPLLEESGLKAGSDFLVAYSPEREDPGNKEFNTSSIPKIVAGISDESRHLASLLYGCIVPKVVEVNSLEIAEATKLVENIYRAVNIGMVNELKMIFDQLDINVWEVIDAAKTKPFGFQAFYPGPGLGGHCIPIDPFYLTWLARKHNTPTRFIELAGEINSKMPDYVLERLVDALNTQGLPLKGSRIGVLGIAYKEDVDDHRESPSFDVIRLLENRGAKVTYNDPYIPRVEEDSHSGTPAMESQELTEEYLKTLDAVVIMTNHSCYDMKHIVSQCQLVVDTRNATKEVSLGQERICRA